MKDRKNWKLQWYWVILKPDTLPCIVLDSGFTPRSSGLCSKQSNTKPMNSIALISRFCWLSYSSLDLRWNGIPGCWQKVSVTNLRVVGGFLAHSAKFWTLPPYPRTLQSWVPGDNSDVSVQIMGVPVANQICCWEEFQTVPILFPEICAVPYPCSRIRTQSCCVQPSTNPWTQAVKWQSTYFMAKDSTYTSEKPQSWGSKAGL